MKNTRRSSTPKSPKLRMNTLKRSNSLNKALKTIKIRLSLKLLTDVNRRSKDKSISNWRMTRRRSKKSGLNVTRTFKTVRTLIIKFTNSPRIKRIRVMIEPWLELMDWLRTRLTLHHLPKPIWRLVRKLMLRFLKVSTLMILEIKLILMLRSMNLMKLSFKMQLMSLLERKRRSLLRRRLRLEPLLKLNWVPRPKSRKKLKIRPKKPKRPPKKKPNNSN